jgi:hypothetical protein
MQKYIGIKQKRHTQTEFCKKQDNQKDNKKKATGNTDTGIFTVNKQIHQNGADKLK